MRSLNGISRRAHTAATVYSNLMGLHDAMMRDATCNAFPMALNLSEAMADRHWA